MHLAGRTAIKWLVKKAELMFWSGIDSAFWWALRSEQARERRRSNLPVGLREGGEDLGSFDRIYTRNITLAEETADGSAALRVCRKEIER